MKKHLFFVIFLSCFTCFVAVSQSSISGRVFNDISGNNAYNAGEELDNITVWLLDLNAVAPYYRVSPVQTTVTNASGIYIFLGVAAGDYQVRVMQSTIPATVTRAVIDNDPYPNGLTTVMGVDGINPYLNIDFGFAPTSVAPVFASDRNFQWNTGNTFINQASQVYNLPAEVCGGITLNPTIAWTTDRTSAPGGGYGTNTYPQAVYPGALLGQGFPGNNKGGIHTGDNTFQLLFGGAGYTTTNNDRQTTTIQFSLPVINTKFSIYDIDHADPQVASGRIDHVKVTGYAGAIEVNPVLVNPSLAPWNTVSGNTIYGFADYPLNGYTLPFNSQNEDHGTINVYFQSRIDRIVIEYEEWAPVILTGKGITDATPPNAAFSEASWADRTASNAPTIRGISIGSIDYTIDCFTILPVSLLYFKATQQACNAGLNWQTAYEQNLDFFAVEYSADGTDFKTLTTVQAKNLAQGSSYQYGVNVSGKQKFYRLKIVDQDGKYQYSNIISTNPCNKTVNWAINPNPVNVGSDFFVNIFSDEINIRQVSLLIWNVDGKKQLKKQYTINQGENTLSVNSKNLLPGVYLIGLLDEFNANIEESKKLIVQ
jgi:hypothetical protein